MKLMLQILVTFALSSLGTQAVLAQTAAEALTALQRLQHRCETGIAYVEYNAALAEATFPLRRFAERGASPAHDEFIAALQDAVKHYEFAGTLWSARFSAPRDDQMLSSGLIWHKGPLGQQIKVQYPEAEMMRRFFPLQTTLPHIWSHAALSLTDAAQRLPPEEPSERQAFTAGKEKLEAELELQALRRENERLKGQLEREEASNQESGNN